VLGVQEEPDAAAGLVADPGGLVLPGRPGQEQPGGAPASRRHHHPPLAAAERGVLGQREAERPGEEGDRLVVVGDEQRGQAEPGAGRGRFHLLLVLLLLLVTPITAVIAGSSTPRRSRRSRSRGGPGCAR